MKAELEWIQTTYGQCIKETGLLLDSAMKMNERIVLEGAQGCLLDIDQGTYPLGQAASQAEVMPVMSRIHPGHIDRVVGTTKAYITRVGNGAMPTELDDESGAHMASVGHEFGTTTGRPRRCGWFDAVVMRHAQRINGFTEIDWTKLDVLGGLDVLKICVAYELDGKEIHEMPPQASALARCKPIYVEMPCFPAHALHEWLEIAKKCNAENLN